MAHIVRAVVVIAVLSLAIGVSAQTSIVYDGAILDRPNVHDGNPAHILWNGTHYIWWGSKGTSGDDIYMSKKVGSLGPGGWTAPTKVFGSGQTGWADNHTNDPSVIGGSFSFSGKSYALAMYYTADRNCGGCNNAIGVAYSKAGSIWNSVTSPVVVPAVNPTTTYGAGMSGAAKDPATGAVLHVYLDSTITPNIRLNSSTNARTISPIPGNATQLASMGRYGDGQGPDIAYHSQSGYWYAAIKCKDQFGQYDGEVRLLKSSQPGTLTGSWSLLGYIDRTVTGTVNNAQPGLGKNLDGSLYIDGSGWAYVFFITGEAAPTITVRAVSQARFRP